MINDIAPETRQRVADAVKGIYEWLYVQIPFDAQCKACGKCCDFEKYGHKLYLTTPELIYFAQNIKQDDLRKMSAGVCPYRENDKCLVHDIRFAGCRIFFCQMDEDYQSQLTEAAIEEFKKICRQYDIPYNYMDLKTALNSL